MTIHEKLIFRTKEEADAFEAACQKVDVTFIPLLENGHGYHYEVQVRDAYQLFFLGCYVGMERMKRISKNVL
jgi:hypothetical protein